MPRPVAASLLALALTGCGHSQPFRPGDYGSGQPFVPGSPRRVTYNIGDDRAPAWLPDESGFLYSFQRVDRPDRDYCLGLLPPAGAASPAPPAVPATLYASSVAPGGTADVIFFTLGGDSRVFRRVRSGATDSVVHDFGAAGIARDVQVAGTRLVAVVGGTISFAYDSLLGYAVQRDAGGFLYLVDLETGAETVLPG